MKEFENYTKRFRRKLFIDYETKSELDVSKVGSHRYCLDSTTELLLVSYAFDDDPVIDSEELPDEVLEAIEDDTVLKIAHNAEFDMCVSKYVLGIDINLNDWHDTAFQAAYYGHPRKLAYLAKRLNTTQKGSQEELFFFSVPSQVAQEAAKDELFAKATPATFNSKKDFPELWEEFREYGRGDIAVMRECFDRMIELPAIETFTMLETFKMNFNGFPFDRELAKRIYDKVEKFEGDAGEEALLKYGITNLRSTDQVKTALLKNGVYLESLDQKKRNGVEHEILELRDQASGSAFSKIPTAFRRICPDGRIRGEFLGNGAHTGRWSAKGTQPHNFARILDAKKVHESLEFADTYGLLRQHMRLCIGHDPNMNFTDADLSQIEARIVAWLADCKWRMEAFRDGVDIYARSAEKMFNKQRVTKDDIERQYGKCAELGFGYGGGEAAIRNIQPKFYKEQGVAKIQMLVDTWRKANPEICRLWRLLESAFKEALKKGRCQLRCGQTFLMFQFDGRNARILLPSGRCLYYRNVVEKLESGSYSTNLYYLDYSRGGEQPVRTKFWGGTILENVTQAIAKDILADIMYRVDKREPRAQMIGTVHDEAWYMHPKTLDLLPIVLEEMSRPIEWAKGLLTKGDGFTSDRYRK